MRRRRRAIHKTLRVVMAFLLCPGFVKSQELAASVRVELVDVNDARISNATITLTSESGSFTASKQGNFTYLAAVRPGTYRLEARSPGFCRVRRADFLLGEHAAVQFRMQMWVCGSHLPLVQYAELVEEPGSHLKPLVLYGSRDESSGIDRFRGPYDYNDGTGHQRQYPTIFTFNLISIQAEEIEYDSLHRKITARGNVLWQDGNGSGDGARVELKLDGLQPKIVSFAE